MNTVSLLVLTNLVRHIDSWSTLTYVAETEPLGALIQAAKHFGSLESERTEQPVKRMRFAWSVRGARRRSPSNTLLGRAVC